MNLDAENQKLVTLAKGARGRIAASAGACVRDQDGRTYSGASVHVADSAYGALELAVATALASGAKSLEAGCVAGDNATEHDVAVFRAVAQAGAPLIVADASGTVLSVTNE
jgi:hypothetical protein